MSRTDNETKFLAWRGYKLARAPGLFAYKGMLRLDDDNFLFFEVKPVRVSPKIAKSRSMQILQGFAAVILFNGQKLITDFGATEGDALERAATVAEKHMTLILSALGGADANAQRPEQEDQERKEREPEHHPAPGLTEHDADDEQRNDHER